MKVETASARNTRKKNRNMVSTVRMAEASMALNAKQGQEKIVARGPGAEKAHDHGVEQQVNRRQQRRVQRRILRVGGEIPGDPPQVRGKPEKVEDHQEGGRAVG